jgi:hypothetical protein
MRKIPIPSTWDDPTMPSWSPWHVVRATQVDLLDQVTVEPAADPEGRFPNGTKTYALQEFLQRFTPHRRTP